MNNEKKSPKFRWSRSFLFNHRSRLVDQMFIAEYIVRSEVLDLISTLVRSLEIYEDNLNLRGKI